MVDRMKMLASETALKYMEEDIMTAEKQIKTLDEQLLNQTENAVDMEQVLQYAKYLLKHLHELVFNTSNPLRRSAFFGLIFNTMPSYADIDFETPKNSPPTDVNRLFRLAIDYKSTSGGLTYPVFEPQDTTELAKDLILLYQRLVELGVEHRDGKVYLADLEEKDV